MTDVKFNSSSSQRAATSTTGAATAPSAFYSIQRNTATGGLGGRDFEFSTSSTHNISDTGAYCDLYDASYDNVSTSAILHYCKLKVLRPYFRLHSLLGWRPLFMQATLFENSIWIRSINSLYTIAILAFIVLGYILQYASCYRQDGFAPYKSHDDSSVHVNTLRKFLTSALNESSSVNETTAPTLYAMRASVGLDGFMDKNSLEPYFTNASMEMRLFKENMSFAYSDLFKSEKGDKTKLGGSETLKCKGNFFAMYLIPSTLHFFAYMFVLHLMRTPESERLENLMERGFLQTSRTTGWFLAHRKLVNSLRSFLWICVAWLLLSLTIHGLEVGTRLLNNRLDYTWIHPSDNFKVVLVCLTVASLTWNDLICGAIVTSYAVHCQLNISYIINLCASIRERRLEFNEFYKRIEESRKFIEYLNSDQALGLSLLEINVGCKVVVAIYALLVSNEFSAWTPRTLTIVLLSVAFWLSLFAVPLIQGVRLTSACRELQKIGHELRSRPFGYQEAQQAELDSLLLYTTTLSMEAKILHVPIRSSCLVVLCVLMLIVVLMLGQLGFLNV